VSIHLSPLVLSSYSFIDVTGIDAERFLQGQLTINISTPDYKTAYLAALCSAKGRVMSLFFISKIALGFRLFMPQSIVKMTVDHLNKYGVFFKTEIKEARPESKLIAFFDHPKESDNRITIANTELSLTVCCNEDEIEAFAHTYSIELKNIDSQWYQYLTKHKIPWLNNDSVEHFLPHDLNLPKLDAVDFKKGCYTGQEIIARMHYKGKLKQHLQRLTSEFNSDILPKTALLQDDKKVGEIICSISSNQKSVSVLALVKDKANIDDFFQLDNENSSILKIEK